MRAHEFVTEKKRKKRRPRWAAYGPGPYGGYGFYAGYSGDSGEGGDGGGGESIEHENFADGKKPGRKGLAKRSGVNTKASVSSLRKTAKNSSGEKQRMAHWLANMKAGRAKKNKQYTMKIREILESATAGATSAANVGVGAVYKNKPGKTAKNKDGTAKNALDLKGTNLLTGGSLVKR